MNKQHLSWQEPSLRQNSARRRRVVVDGLDLQEDRRNNILTFSLCRDYTEEQHKRIRRFRIRKTRFGHGNRKLSIIGRTRYIPIKKQLIIKQTFDGGVGIW